MISPTTFLELRERAHRAGIWLERHDSGLRLLTRDGKCHELHTIDDRAVWLAPPLPTLEEQFQTPEGRARAITALRLQAESNAKRATDHLIYRAKQPRKK